MAPATQSMALTTARHPEAGIFSSHGQRHDSRAWLSQLLISLFVHWRAHTHLLARRMKHTAHPEDGSLRAARKRHKNGLAMLVVPYLVLGPWLQRHGVLAGWRGQAVATAGTLPARAHSLCTPHCPAVVACSMSGSPDLGPAPVQGCFTWCTGS